MWPDRVSNSGPLALESDALPTALRGLASLEKQRDQKLIILTEYLFTST